MRWSCFLPIGLLILGLALASACSATEGDPLDADRRLEQRVSVKAPLATLDVVLKSVQEQCGVPLVAAPDIEANTVVVLVRDRPARELLRQLATTLGFTWTRQEGEAAGFRLLETEVSRARARALAREYRRQAGAELEQQLRLTLKYLEKYRGMERREILADIERLRTESMQLPVSRERLAAEAEQFAAERSYEPTVQALLTAYLALPEALQEQLLDGRRVTMTTLRPGTVRMPPPVLASLRASRQFEVLRASRGTEPPVARQSDDEVIDFLTGMRFGRLLLEIRGRRLGDLRNRPALSLPRFVLSPSQLTFGQTLTDASPGQVSAEDPKQLEQRIPFSWVGKRLQKEDPLTYCRGVLLSDVLQRLVEQAPSLQIVGDAYYKALRPLPRTKVVEGAPEGFDPAESALARLTRGPGPDGQPSLADLLRELANRGNTNIHLTRDGWMRFRSTIYFNDRPAAIDPRTIRELYGGIAAGEPYTREVAMRVAGRLTYPQVETLSADFLAFFPGQWPIWRMRGSWDSWKLLGTLTEEHRRMFFARQPLRYQALSSDERKAVRTMIDELSNRLGEAALDLDLGPRELPSLTLGQSAPGPDGAESFELRAPGFVEPLLRQSLLVQQSAPRPAMPQ